jgi:integrase
MTQLQSVDVSELPSLPEQIETLDGIKFDPRNNVWSISGLTGKENLDFSVFNAISDKMVYCLKWGIVSLLQNKSFSHSRNIFGIFLLFYRVAIRDRQGITEVIEISHLLTFKAYLNAATEWKLGGLRILLTDLERLGFSIATAETMEYLASATIRGNIKGTSIRTRDADKGTFTDIELLAIQSALNDTYARGDIDLYAFAITWLLLAYGARPIQIAALKEGDLIVSEGSEGRLYALRIPRAKQRGQKVRDSIKTVYCGKQVGYLLERVIEYNSLRRECFGLIRGECPMFIADEEGRIPNFRHHLTSRDIAGMLRTSISRVTGIKTNSKRFRITLAQRATDDGKDKYTVAELLDHSDTQSVEVYFEASPAMVLRLDRHLAIEMAPLAQAFAGVVVASEQEARRGDDRSSRIFDRSLNNVTQALGTCGQMSFCGLAAPFACYTCRHFQPWIDGPHEEFMDALIADRDRLEAEGYSPKIFTIRDRTILAVAEVIQLCVSEKKVGPEVVI